MAPAEVEPITRDFGVQNGWRCQVDRVVLVEEEEEEEDERGEEEEEDAFSKLSSLVDTVNCCGRVEWLRERHTDTRTRRNRGGACHCLESGLSLALLCVCVCI